VLCKTQDTHTTAQFNAERYIVGDKEIMWALKELKRKTATHSNTCYNASAMYQVLLKPATGLKRYA